MQTFRTNWKADQSQFSRSLK